MSVRVVDHSAAFRHAIGVRLASNLGDAAELLRVEIEAAIGVQGPPRSAPGEIPHRDTGVMQGSFTDELDANALVARVGTDTDYAVIHEIGVRPFIIPTLLANAAALGRVICRPI